jgi:hypothetical protein
MILDFFLFLYMFTRTVVLPLPHVSQNQEITKLYQDAACLIPDDTRVDNTKFAMVAMSRGLIPSRFDYF